MNRDFDLRLGQGFGERVTLRARVDDRQCLQILESKKKGLDLRAVRFRLDRVTNLPLLFRLLINTVQDDLRLGVCEPEAFHVIVIESKHFLPPKGHERLVDEILRSEVSE
jgi:hypothetical protein